MVDKVELYALRVDQPIGSFYVGAISAKILNEIAYADVRELVHGGGEAIGGIQRNLSSKRVHEIAEYTASDAATFPTSVVLAVDERCVSISPVGTAGDLVLITITGYEGSDEHDKAIPIDRSALIIDGQHRLAGLAKSQRDGFEVNVSIFIGADKADQAAIFATVNLAQTKVNNSLAYDLLSFARKRTVEKVCHEIVVALDRDPSSPFFKKIKRLGVATPGRDNETLSQATVVRGLMQYLHEKEGFFSIVSRSSDPQRHIFQPFYDSGREVEIFELVRNYFNAARGKWTDVWDDPPAGNILVRTNGFNALVRLFRPIYLSIATPGQIVGEDDFSQRFSLATLSGHEITSGNFSPGSSGATNLYKTLYKQILGSVEINDRQTTMDLDG